MRRPRRSDVLFVTVLLAWHAAAFALARHWGRIYMGDSHEYVFAAHNLLQRGILYSGDPSLPFTAEEATLRTPLYPALLAAVYALRGSDWAVLIIQAVLSTASFFLVRDALLRVGYHRRWDAVFLILALSYPAQAIHAMEVEPEALLQLLTVLYFRSLLFVLVDRDKKHHWYASLWLILGLLTKPVLYPVVAVHLLGFAVLTVQRSRPRRIALLIAGLLPVLTVVLYNSWNKGRTGKWHFTSNQAFNALYYYYPFVEHRAGHDSARRFIHRERAALAAIPRFADRYDQAQARGWALLGEHASAYIPFHLLYSARLLVDPGKADLDLFTGRLTYDQLYSVTGASFSDVWKTQRWRGLPGYAQRNPSLPVALGVLLFNLARLGGLGFFLTRRNVPVPARLLVAGFVLYFCAITGPIAAPRYLLPAAPLIIGGAAWGWGRILTRRKSTALAHASQA